MRALSFVFGLCLGLLLTGCSPQPANTPDNQSPASSSSSPTSASAPVTTTQPTATAADVCKLMLGYEAWEPYQYTGLDQKAAGLDIELISAVAKNMNCQLVTKQGAWMDLVQQLRDGKIDMVAGASRTAAREQFALFSAPYRQEQFQLFVLTSKSASMPESTLSEFVDKGHKIGIISEYFYGDEFGALYQEPAKKSAFVEASLGELNIARLLDGDIDGMLEDSFVARSMLRRKGLSDQIGQQGIVLQSNDVYVMFSKVSVPESQVIQFNQALKNIRNSGEYMLIIDKYQQ